MVVTLAAHGNLDALVDVFRQRRSQFDPVSCDLTDDAGRAATNFRAVSGATYFIRVAEQANSESSTFALRLVLGPAPAQPPGRALRAGGIRVSAYNLI